MNNFNQNLQQICRKIRYISSLTDPYRINRLTMQINNSRNQNNQMPYEIRKVQDSMRCIMVSIPKRFARWMRVEKGSLVKIQFNSDEQAGNRIIIQKVYFKEGEDV